MIFLQVLLALLIGSHSIEAFATIEAAQMLFKLVSHMKPVGAGPALQDFQQVSNVLQSRVNLNKNLQYQVNQAKNFIRLAPKNPEKRQHHRETLGKFNESKQPKQQQHKQQHNINETTGLNDQKLSLLHDEQMFPICLSSLEKAEHKFAQLNPSEQVGVMKFHDNFNSYKGLPVEERVSKASLALIESQASESLAMLLGDAKERRETFERLFDQFAVDNVCRLMNEQFRTLFVDINENCKSSGQQVLNQTTGWLEMGAICSEMLIANKLKFYKEQAYEQISREF